MRPGTRLVCTSGCELLGQRFEGQEEEKDVVVHHGSVGRSPFATEPTCHSSSRSLISLRMLLDCAVLC